MDIDINLTVPDIDDEGFFRYYNYFTDKLDYYKSRITFREINKQRNGVSTIIKLSKSYKDEIHNLINKIRQITESANLTDKKKDAIYNKLSALSLEVDKSRTRSEALLSLYFDITNAASEGAENLDPLIERVERLMKIFGRAKREQEQGQLPAPEKPKQLNPPKGDSDDAECENTGLDDEIPF